MSRSKLLAKFRRWLVPAFPCSLFAAVFGLKLLEKLAPSLFDVRLELDDAGEVVCAALYIGSQEVLAGSDDGTRAVVMRYLNRGANVALRLSPEQFVETGGELPVSATKRLRAAVGHALSAWTPFNGEDLLFSARSESAKDGCARVGVRYALSARIPGQTSASTGSVRPYDRILFDEWSAPSEIPAAPRIMKKIYEAACLILPVVLLPTFFLMDMKRIEQQQTRAFDLLNASIAGRKTADRARHELDELRRAVDTSSSATPADAPGLVLAALDSSLPPEVRVKQLEFNQQGVRAVLWQPWNGEPASSAKQWILRKLSSTEIAIQRNPGS